MPSKLQTHHIIYDPEWTVELSGVMHQTVTSIQRMKATPENYAKVTNFMHAVSYLWNELRMKLDIGD